MKSCFHHNWRRAMCAAATAASVCGLLLPWILAGHQAGRADGARPAGQAAPEAPPQDPKEGPGGGRMQVYYLEIVTKDVAGVCNAYAAAMGVQFSEPVPALGQARTAAMPGGGMVGVRAPLRDTEQPVVRPYWLVDDIRSALAAALKAGGQLAHEPLEIPGHGTFAIYFQGGNDHGLWQR